uniref:Uncharacterized protein n=1 Tax=Knipowitschia caucasica TaxID=637954 RepID=A0AAV2LRG9_KNICA
MGPGGSWWVLVGPGWCWLVLVWACGSWWELVGAAVSNLEKESKLSLHYQAQWHQSHSMIHPCTRPPCLEEQHRNAHFCLRALQQDELQKRSSSRERNRVTISISMAPPMPTFPSPHTIRRQQRSRLARAQEREQRELELDYQTRKEMTVRETELQTGQKKERSVREEVQRKFECFYSLHPIDGCNFIPWNRKSTSTSECEVAEVPGEKKAKAPSPATPTMQDKQTSWTREKHTSPDPNPVSSCIIPINVTGVGFDREASARCSLVHSQSVLQRRRKLRRRKTITGIPKRVQHDMGTAAPSRRRIRAQRGHQGLPASLSHSTGNISVLDDPSESTYSRSTSHSRLRSRSLPREGGRLLDSDEDDDDDNYDDDDDDEEDEELSPYEAEDFIPSGPSPRMKMMMMKDEEESTDDQAAPEPLQLGTLKRLQRSGDRGGGSPEHNWMERGRSRMPRKADMGSCEISSSSDTFSSPIHSVSTTGVMGTNVDHKEDHQSSSGNWSGSSSTCPSQTSETIPPPSSPPLTGSSHCDSELSLNTVPNASDEGYSLDPAYHTDLRPQGQGHRSSSFTSSATDQLDDAGVSTASEGEWAYPPDQDQIDPDQENDLTQNQNHGLSQEYSSKGVPDQTCSMDKDGYPVDTDSFYFSPVNSGDCNQTYRGYMYNYAEQGSESGQNTVAAPLQHGVYNFSSVPGRCHLVDRHQDPRDMSMHSRRNIRSRLPQAGIQMGLLHTKAYCSDMIDDDDDEEEEEEEEEAVKEPLRPVCSRLSIKADHPPPPAYGGYHSDSGPWSSPLKVPGSTAETSHPYLISDVRRGGPEDHVGEEEVTSGATRSAHQQQFFESKDDSTTPDTEDYFSKDSTPSDNSLSPVMDDGRMDDDIIITSPNKSRTTEDLFAMIHRSKRKVLGRKDSGDINAKSRLCLPPPVTSGTIPTIIVPPAPPASVPVLPVCAAGPPRVPVPIYRSAKKSSTSNEEFKLLLLKKGSRSDTSYRMSAIEILKSPITPKTPGESLHDGPMRQNEDLSSALQEAALSNLEPVHIPGLYPRANTESFTPKTLAMSAASRQGRSRVPPVASSSRYSTRSRLYTAPMQAISEGDTENSDGSPHDDRSS